MRKMVGYKTLESRLSEHLDELVMESMDDGWTVYGKQNVAAAHDGLRMTYAFFQVMVKYEFTDTTPPSFVPEIRTSGEQYHQR